MHRLLILGAMLAMLWLPTIAVTATEPTCELKPLTIPLFDGTPVYMLASPAATPAGQVLEEIAARDILEMYVACTNTGDPTLIWAMFTPRWFSVQFADPEEQYLPQFEYEIANGTGPVENPLILKSIDSVEMQVDGRFAVTATFSSGDSIWVDQLFLSYVDGHWLIDDVIFVSPSD